MKWDLTTPPGVYLSWQTDVMEEAISCDNRRKMKIPLFKKKKEKEKKCLQSLALARHLPIDD